jgi:hypothetical protein
MRIEKFNLRWEALMVGTIAEPEDRGSKTDGLRLRKEDRMKVARKKSGGASLSPPE